MNWQPIETAPSSPDGKLKVLTYDPTEKPDCIQIQIADGDWWRKNAKSRGPWTAPTHWMPLPPQPTTDK